MPTTRTPSNVVNFADAQHEARAEAEFAKLLDKETQIEGNIEPLSVELISNGKKLRSRIDALRARVEEKQHSALLEG
ncbi:hypothetical protein [Photobacterium sp. Hal280]|uniref:hypothetical protein n=1 Tax=Photobacterium sp. Hal280 TaxID=3035163 RepID=UPI00301D2B0A